MNGLVRTGLILLVVLFYQQGATGKRKSRGSNKPNIIYILADDLGWADVGFSQTSDVIDYDDDSKYWQTPNLDRLATEEGVIFSRHYTHPTCSPSRAALLTGKYPFRYGYTLATLPFQDLQPEQTNLFPKLLSDYLGYETLITGKWHNGRDSWSSFATGFFDKVVTFNSAINYWTHRVCFAQTLWGIVLPDYSDIAGTQLDSQLRQRYPATDVGFCFYGLFKGVEEPYLDDFTAYGNDTYSEDIFFDTIVDYIYQYAERSSDSSSSSDSSGSSGNSDSSDSSGSSGNSDSSDSSDSGDDSDDDAFFIYWPSFIPHATLRYPPYDADSVERCSSITNEGRNILCLMMQYLDKKVGELSTVLKTLDLWDNTLIVFSSDNGGAPAVNPYNKDFLGAFSGFGTNLPLRGGKLSTFEGGVRGVSFATGGLVPENARGQKLDKLIGIEDWFITLLNLAGIENVAQDNEELQAILDDTDSFDIWPAIEALNSGSDSSSDSSSDSNSDSNSDSSSDSDSSSNSEDSSDSTDADNERTEWVDIGLTGTSCIVRDDGLKLVINGFGSSTQLLYPGSPDFVEYDQSSNTDISNYSPYSGQMVFNVFEDESETNDLTDDASMTGEIGQLKAKFGEYTNQVQIKLPGDGGLGALKAAIDTKTITPWKDYPEYDGVTDALAVYAELLTYEYEE